MIGRDPLGLVIRSCRQGKRLAEADEQGH